VDYLKYDNCNAPSNETTDQLIARYNAMRDAIAATGRPIVYSISEYGNKFPSRWAPKVANLWRTTGDIRDSYASMLTIFHANVGLFAYSGRGGWNDPDMLQIGNGGMTMNEYRSEFSLWSAMAAPLIAGTDLRGPAAPYLSIYTNREVIAVDQDRLGKQAAPISSAGGHWVLSKPLANGDRAVVLFNETDQPAAMSTTAAAVGMPHTRTYRLRDLWTHSTSKSSGAIRATVPAHDVVMYRVTSLGPTIEPESISYEAESSSNALRGGARVGVCAACSGGSKAGWVGHGGSLTFTNVHAAVAGNYQVAIAYCDGSTTGRRATIAINGGVPQSVHFAPTGSFTKPGILVRLLRLAKGNNTITFANPTEYAPDFDRITIRRPKTR
jgi:hypothetical protein